MKIYLSGKVTGLDPVETRKKFCKYEKRLKVLGYEVVNPVRHISPFTTWELAMRKAIELMMQCDTIFLIEDWIASEGAKIEFQLSYKLKYRIMSPNELDSMERVGLKNV